ncbi:MAG TPA: phosphoglucosamine mutase [Candidatus Didemnitutus sp.]|nr:phosphoglucosamine mutase [Candidatus Didemnitutus sp.]
MAPSRKFFGTDGVRGEYGGAVMNDEFAWRLGAAAGRFVIESGGTKGGLVVIGRDTRASGAALERAIAGGLASAGLKPETGGVVPTPAVSLAVRKSGAVLGVVITASHNPAADNGIKFFGSRGSKLSDEQEARIEELLPASAGSAWTGPLVERDLRGPYTELATRLLGPQSLPGWKIVLDAANGAGAVTSRTVLAALGADLTLIGDRPDGHNINAGVGSQHPEALGQAVRNAGARLGVAHDGDADRCVLCDETGDPLDGDEILVILALEALARNQLANQELVVTVQSNLGVDAAIRAAGGKVVRTPVGDRYVSERMQADNAVLGGESSGHVVCADISPTGDGLVAALKVIAAMRRSNRPLSELRRSLKKFPQETSALRVREKIPLEKLVVLPAEIQSVQTELGDRGRVLVRYSGTEPVLRLLVEGESNDVVGRMMGRLVAAAGRELRVEQ